MSDEMYPDVCVDQLTWHRDNEKNWPCIDDVSCVTIVTSAWDWIADDAEVVLKR